MKRKILSFLIVSAIGLLTAAVVFAQSNDDARVASVVSEMYVISAKAGGVNYTQGKVAVARNDSRSGYLIKGDKLEAGEKVSTGTNGRAEILLNPGSFVRLAENTEFEFVSTSLDDLKIKLSRGSAMFEVIADKEFNVFIQTPKAGFYAIDSGIYRIDVLPDGSGKIFVWDGKAEVGGADGAVVKKGRTATVNGKNVSIEKFDRDDNRDELVAWSKSRAKELSKINSRLRREDLRNSLINSFNRRGWGFYDSFGLWVFDRFSGQYCFLPFGSGWASPYGYWYGRDIWYYRLPRFIYYQPQPTNTGSPNPNTSPSAVNRERGERNSTPPFRRIEGSNGRTPAPATVAIPEPRRSTSPPLAPRSSSPKGKPDND